MSNSSRFPSLAAISGAVALGALGGVLGAGMAARSWHWSTFWSAAQALTTLGAFVAAASYARIAKQQLQVFIAQSVVEHKPVVVTVREEDPDTHGFHYYVLNVGRGTAINVWYAEIVDDKWHKTSLGALGPGGRRLLPSLADTRLCDEVNAMLRHVLVAEGIATRTNRWTLTGNARGTDRGSSMRHVIIRVDDTERASPDDLFDKESLAVHRQLEAVPISGLV